MIKQEISTLALNLKPIQSFLDDNQWTEICINKPYEVFTENNQGWTCHKIPDITQRWCLNIAKLIANASQQTIDSEHPILSAQLINGERIQIVIPPAVPEGTTSITIRKSSNILLMIDDIESQGAFKHVVIEANNELQPDETYLLQLLKQKQIKAFITEAVLEKPLFPRLLSNLFQLKNA